MRVVSDITIGVYTCVLLPSSHHYWQLSLLLGPCFCTWSPPQRLLLPGSTLLLAQGHCPSGEAEGQEKHKPQDCFCPSGLVWRAGAMASATAGTGWVWYVLLSEVAVSLEPTAFLPHTLHPSTKMTWKDTDTSCSSSVGCLLQGKM